MAYERLVEGQLDYAPCRYGESKLSFRGPAKALTEQYLTFLGSTKTYGKFVTMPYPSLVGRVTGLTAVNLGCVNAGVDTFHNDAALQQICWNAEACVIQVMGAHKLSNRFYSVHVRRNDRFLGASKLLRQLYPEIDFADIHFTRHLTSTLARGRDPRFEVVRKELRRAWSARMTRLIGRMRAPVILLWVSPRSVDGDSNDPDGPEPLFVTRAMIEGLRPRLAGFVEVLSEAVRNASLPAGMVCLEAERAAARELPGPETHTRAAAALATALETAT